MISGSIFIFVSALYGMGTPQEIQKEDKELPIFYAHALKNDHTCLDTSISILKKYVHKDTKIFTSDIGFYGFAPEDAQAQEFANFVNNTPEFKDGFTVIGYSNGGIPTRLAIEEGLLEYPVVSYISIASPQRGVCHFPGTWDSEFDAKIKKYVPLKPLSIIEQLAHKVLYPLNDFPIVPSVVQIWNAPEQQAETTSGLISTNPFFEKLNNEGKQDSAALKRKHNLCTLAILHSIAASKDTMVDPWQSGRWDYPNKDASKIVPIEQSPIYENLGLKELGNNFSCTTIEGATHCSIHEDEQVIREQVVPYLGRESQRDIGGGKNNYEVADVALWRRCICCK